MERFIKELKSLGRGRGSLASRGLETALKIVVQDEGGRRRTVLDPKAALVKDVPSKASAGGAMVLYPATAYLLKAQKRYETWFGARESVARSVDPLSAKELASQRVLQAKPRLSSIGKSHELSEKRQLQKHAESCHKAVQKARSLTADGSSVVVQGVLGEMTLTPQKRPLELQDTAAAMWDMHKRRKQRREDPEAPAAGTGAARHVEQSAVDIQMGIDWTEANSAMAVQKEVLDKKMEARTWTLPNHPVPYVDSKGGLMRPKGVHREARQEPPELPLPAHLKVLKTPEVDRGTALAAGGTLVRLGHKAHLVFVKSLLLDLVSPECFQARLDGSEVKDTSGRSLHYRGVHDIHIVLYVTTPFQETYPAHTSVLRACCSRSPTVGPAKAKVPRLEVYFTDDVPDTIRLPSLTYKVVVSHGPQCVRKDVKNSEITVSQLTFQGLMDKLGRCYA